MADPSRGGPYSFGSGWGDRWQEVLHAIGVKLEPDEDTFQYLQSGLTFMVVQGRVQEVSEGLDFLDLNIPQGYENVEDVNPFLQIESDAPVTPYRLSRRGSRRQRDTNLEMKLASPNTLTQVRRGCGLGFQNGRFVLFEKEVGSGSIGRPSLRSNGQPQPEVEETVADEEPDPIKRRHAPPYSEYVSQTPSPQRSPGGSRYRRSTVPHPGSSMYIPGFPLPDEPTNEDLDMVDYIYRYPNHLYGRPFQRLVDERHPDGGTWTARKIVRAMHPNAQMSWLSRDVSQPYSALTKRLQHFRRHRWRDPGERIKMVKGSLFTRRLPGPDEYEVSKQRKHRQGKERAAANRRRKRELRKIREGLSSDEWRPSSDEDSLGDDHDRKRRRTMGSENYSSGRGNVQQRSMGSQSAYEDEDEDTIVVQPNPSYRKRSSVRAQTGNGMPSQDADSRAYSHGAYAYPTQYPYQARYSTNPQQGYYIVGHAPHGYATAAGYPSQSRHSVQGTYAPSGGYVPYTPQTASSHYYMVTDMHNSASDTYKQPSHRANPDHNSASNTYNQPSHRPDPDHLTHAVTANNDPLPPTDTETVIGLTQPNPSDREAAPLSNSNTTTVLPDEALPEPRNAFDDFFDSYVSEYATTGEDFAFNQVERNASGRQRRTRRVAESGPRKRKRTW
ncbi:MAG: hypothetical protein Q9227_003529 [Pyrenula ochraceoflavens]